MREYTRQNQISSAISRRQFVAAALSLPVAALLAAVTPAEAEAAARPAKVSLGSYTPVSKGVKVSWKAVSRAKGYQVKAYTSKKLSKCVATKAAKGTSVTVGGLGAGRFYYVRVRAWRTSGGKRVYGAWSAPKLVHTKLHLYGGNYEKNAVNYVKSYRKCTGKAVEYVWLSTELLPYTSDSYYDKVMRKYKDVPEEDRFYRVWVDGGGNNVVGSRKKSDPYGSVLYSYDVTEGGGLFDYYTGKWIVKK